MSWTYDVTQLQNTPLFQVRFRIGDTDQQEALLQDEEIMYILSTVNNDITSACIQCCQIIIANMSKNPDFTVGPYTESNKNRIQIVKDLYSTFLQQQKQGHIPISLNPTTGPIFEYDMMCFEHYGREHE